MAKEVDYRATPRLLRIDMLGLQGNRRLGISFMTEQPKPDWWPECPWRCCSLDLALLEARKMLRAKFNDNQFEQIIDALMRHGWRCAEKEILERLKERGVEL